MVEVAASVSRSPGALGAVKQAEHLGMTAVAVRNLEKRGIWKSLD
jgi:hypothetical protein